MGGYTVARGLILSFQSLASALLKNYVFAPIKETNPRSEDQLVFCFARAQLARVGVDTLRIRLSPLIFEMSLVTTMFVGKIVSSFWNTFGFYQI